MIDVAAERAPDDAPEDATDDSPHLAADTSGEAADVSFSDARAASADADARCPQGDWLPPGGDVFGIVGPATPQAPFACTRERAAVQYFRLLVPARRAVTLSLTARGAGVEHLRVQLLDGCEDRCLIGGDRSLNWRNDRAEDRVLVAAVYGVGAPAFDVAFVLRMDLGPPDVIVGCEVATPVTLPARVIVADPTLVPPTRATCGVSGRVAWFRVVVPARYALVAASTPRGAAGLIAADVCDASACTLATNGVLRVPVASVERAVFVGVQPTAAVPAEVEFGLLAETSTGAPPTCEAPAPLALPASLDGPIFASGEALLHAACALESPRARFYRVEIPPRSRLVVESTNDTAAVALITQCDQNLCWNPPSSARIAARENPGADAVPATIAVVRRSLGVLANAAVRVRATPMPPEHVCETAPLIPPSGEVSLTFREGERIRAAVECGPTLTIYASHYYALDVPPRTAVRVEVPSSLRVALIPGCGARSCVGTSTNFMPHTARWSNDADTSTRVVVAVSDVSTPMSAVVRAELVPYEASMRCETGGFLTDVPQATTTRYGIDLRVCWSSSMYPQPAAWWRLRVPVGRQARVVVEGPRSTIAPYINVSRTCGAFNCVPASSLWNTERGEMVVINDGPEETLYLQIVADEAPRRISATLEDPPANRRCADATPLTPGVERSAERLPVSGDRAPACAPIGWAAASAYYRVEVPPRARLRVSSRASQPIALRLYDGCNVGTCAAASELSATPTLTWTNNTDAPASRLVVVSPRDNLPERAREGFSVVAAIEPTPDGG